MKISLPKTVKLEFLRIKNDFCSVPLLILRPKTVAEKKPVCLWLHGGGFWLGMKEMALMGRPVDLVDKFGVTVVSPGYTLSFQKPYPQALIDCYSALLFIKDNISFLNGKENQIFVGGESAGGALCVSVCLLARSLKQVKIAYQMPLYPMLDCYKTPSSKDNHGKIWNTRKNDFAWKLYLRNYNDVPIYASPSRESDFSNLPPCYTFVGDGEPFYFETLEYVKKLSNAGIEAKVDVYHSDVHAFDMMKPNLEISRVAIEKFNHHFEEAMKNYFSD